MDAFTQLQIATILHEKMGIPFEVADDVINEVQNNIYLTLTNENPNYLNPESVLDDFYIPRGFLWAFLL